MVGFMIFLGVMVPITGVAGYVIGCLLTHDQAYWKGYADALKRCPGDYVDPS